MCLNARNRNLAAGGQPDRRRAVLPASATLRLTLSDPLFYLLGYWYGDAALVWMERRSPARGASMLRAVERWFGKASYPLVFLAPNNYICLFAGAAGMPLPVFLA